MAVGWESCASSTYDKDLLHIFDAAVLQPLSKAIQSCRLVTATSSVPKPAAGPAAATSAAAVALHKKQPGLGLKHATALTQVGCEETISAVSVFVGFWGGVSWG
jgi:hypothetical protein